MSFMKEDHLLKNVTEDEKIPNASRIAKFRVTKAKANPGDRRCRPGPETKAPSADSCSI